MSGTRLVILGGSLFTLTGIDAIKLLVYPALVTGPSLHRSSLPS